MTCIRLVNSLKFDDKFLLEVRFSNCYHFRLEKSIYVFLNCHNIIDKCPCIFIKADYSFGGKYRAGFVRNLLLEFNS